MSRLNRRDFLKISLGVPAAAGLARAIPSLLAVQPKQAAKQANIIVIVLDTLSGKNLSVYGYPRRTTPNFERFAQRATIYHAHRSGGNFTVPGTATILSGMYPWTHRAINQSGFMARQLTDRNIFRITGDSYNRFAFAQNLWAVHLLSQFPGDIDALLPPTAFSLTHQVIAEKLSKDVQSAYLSLDEFLFWEENPPASLIFGIPERALLGYKSMHAEDQNFDYPSGLPNTTLLPIFFRLEEVFEGVRESIRSLSPPYLAYIHLWGVHLPYRPHERFRNVFNGGWQPQEKPRHEIGGRVSFPEQLKKLERYDEYIASVDYEFGRLLDRWEQDGTLEDSYVFLTADHGESFERGIQGHTTPTLFEPLVHIPLIVSAPGQTQRVDITAPTNSVDILPSLAWIAGQPIPDWCEGQPLPGLGGEVQPGRSTFSIESKSTPFYYPMYKSSVAMHQGNYKLVYYIGEDYNFFELYDLENDPEELNNSFNSIPSIAGPMKAELLYRFDTANRPYQRS